MSELVITMKMDGITGDSQVAKDEADLVGFVYSASTPIETQGTGLAASGGAHMTPVSVHKKVCSATPKLENQFFTGAPIKTVVLKEYKTDGKEVSPYMVVTLTNAYLSTYAVQPGSYEAFELHYETIEREYFERDTATGSLTSKGKTKFDVLTKKAS
jgi:type VI secretion system secreted protein Hcp